MVCSRRSCLLSTAFLVAKGYLAWRTVDVPSCVVKKVLAGNCGGSVLTLVLRDFKKMFRNHIEHSKEAMVA